jgi:hypothetical protein
MQDDLSADTGKVPLDFVIFHHRVLRRDVLQQKPKRGDIPLALAQRLRQVDVLTSQGQSMADAANCSLRSTTGSLKGSIRAI